MGKEDIHIVTGAAGRTGFPLCLELLKRGAKVRALYNVENEAVAQLKKLGCNVAFCDITQPSDIDKSFAGGTYVYHLAGIVSIETKGSEILELVNVVGTQNVIDGCLKHKIKRLIYTGSVHMLDAHIKGVITEPDRFDESKVDGGYSKTKVRAGNHILDAVRERGLNAVIAMPSAIIGPYEWTNSNFGEMVAQVADGKLRVYIKGKYDFVDVRDLCSALCDLAVKGKSGESYIVSGNVITTKEMMNIVAAAAGVKKIRNFAPLFLVRMFARAVERRALRKRQKPTFTPYSMKVLQDNCNFSHEKLTSLTGYSPRPIEISLKDHTDFYLARRGTNNPKK